MVKGGLAALVVLSLSHMVPPVEIMRMLVILVTSGMLMNSISAMKHQMIGKIFRAAFSISTTSLFSIIVCMNVFIGSTEAVNPNMQKDYDTLPGMKMWDGKPYYEFRIKWWLALIGALGSIFQEGWTLIQTANGVDVGGPNGPVNPTPAQQSQRTNRNLRLFYCILNYISPKSTIHRMARTTFGGDGMGLFNYLYTFGHMPYTRRQLNARDAAWKEATIETLKIPIDENTVYSWYEWVEEQGNKLAKTSVAKREKFLDGFPESFDHIVIPERSSVMNGGHGTHICPINYPAHYPVALAGQPHPQAGEPDTERLAQQFTYDWQDFILMGKIRPKRALAVEQVRSIPEDMVFQLAAEAGPSDDERHAKFEDLMQIRPSEKGKAFQIIEYADDKLCLAVKKDSITAKTVCMTCGGRGHVSRVDGMTCMTLTLGVEVPKDVVKQVTYPDGVTFPVFKPRPGPGRGGPSARPRSGYDSSGGKSRVREVVLDKKTQNDSDSDNEQEVQLAIDVGSISI